MAKSKKSPTGGSEDTSNDKHTSMSHENGNEEIKPEHTGGEDHLGSDNEDKENLSQDTGEIRTATWAKGMDI